MSNVVAIGSGALPLEPVEDVVTTLSELLELAKQGVVRGVSYAIVRPDGVRVTGWESDGAVTTELHSSTCTLAHRLTAAVLSD